MKERPVDLLRDLLDAELIDVDDVSCGRVDDVEIEATAHGLVVKALLVGPGTWQPRLPALLRPASRALFGSQRVRVPLGEVTHIAEVVRLRSRAGELGLGVLDRRAGRWLAKLPRT